MVLLLMKLFLKLSLVLLLLSGCMRSVYSIKNDTEGDFEFVSANFVKYMYVSTAEGWNGRQYLGYVYSLNYQERKLHKNAVYFALDNSKDGEFIYWKSDTSKALGKVRVVFSYPISNGYCRIYQSYITLNGDTHFATHQACKAIFNNWSFNSNLILK